MKHDVFDLEYSYFGFSLCDVPILLRTFACNSDIEFYSQFSQNCVFTGEKPQARADHTCSLWRYCDDGVWKDLLVVFGGSTDYGTTNDVWLYDFRWKK